MATLDSLGLQSSRIDRSWSREQQSVHEDLMVPKCSPDLLNNVKIGEDQLRLIMKHILFYGGWGHFGQVTLNIIINTPSKTCLDRYVTVQMSGLG